MFMHYIVVDPYGLWLYLALSPSSPIQSMLNSYQNLILLYFPSFIFLNFQHFFPFTIQINLQNWISPREREGVFCGPFTSFLLLRFPVFPSLSPQSIHSIILSLLWKVFLLVLPAQSTSCPSTPLPLLLLLPLPLPCWVFIQQAARERVEQSRSRCGCFDCVSHSVRHLVDRW